MRYRAILHLVLFSFFILRHFSIGYSQEVTVNASLDTNELLIGDQIKLKLTTTVSSGSNIDWPLITDTIVQGIEVVSRDTADTSLQNDQTTITQSYTITSFDSGYYVIPPFKFMVNGDSSNIVETEPFLIQVKSIAVDTTEAIKDIKGPIDVPITLEEMYPYIIAGIALIALLIAGFFLYKRYKNKEKPILIKKTVRPAYLFALEKLKELEKSKLWQQNKVKLYHSELTEIVRHYIEKRFGIIAMELTSDEILNSIKYAGLGEGAQLKLRQILSLADMVKFAKVQPKSSDHELSMEAAYYFVDQTSSTVGSKSAVEEEVIEDNQSEFIS